MMVVVDAKRRSGGRSGRLKGGIDTMMNGSILRIALASALLAITFEANAGNPTKADNRTGLAKTTTNDVYRPMLINNVLNYYSNNGDGSYNRFSAANEGFQSPKEKDLCTLMFEDGIVWGCKQRDTIKFGGSVYRHGLQAGPILVNGTVSTVPVADDPGNPANRLYRVRRDLKPIQGVIDPNDPLAGSERAILEYDEVPLIGQYEAITAEQLLQQYWDDWMNWPAAQGAPYADLDHNGTYDPAIDIPGVPLADQTIWYVANDLDPRRTINLGSCDPIGFEMQKTIWAYNRIGPVGNTIFAKTTLINKGGVQADSVYLGQWSDPDVGNFHDDFAGCDTALNLCYAYNGATSDVNFAAYGLVPPAVGFDFLQGPMVKGAPTDTALFASAYRPGFKNLPMTAFVFFSEAYAPYVDPTSGPGQHIEWYRVLKGTVGGTGAPFVNPVTGNPTCFLLSGDPVAGTGWVDGNPCTPSDRRMIMSSGPFTMAPGDTQEVVVACIASRGASNLLSVSALKTDDRVIQHMYNSLNQEIPPRMSCGVITSTNQATISFRADASDVSVSAVKINLKTYGDAAVASVTLADDGSHDDGAAGDGIFGGSVLIPQLQTGLHAEAEITYHDGNTLSWAHTFDNISTAKLSVTSYSIASDNINNDGVTNPGENVRYIFSMSNNSSLAFTGLSTTAISVWEQQRLSLPALDANATFSLSYDHNDPTTYMAFDVPTTYRDSTFAVALVTTDTSHNEWRDTLLFPVAPLKYRLYNTPLSHVLGKASGEFAVSIVDSTQVKNHLYIIRGVDSVGTPCGYTLKDSTTGIVLIQNHPLPDSLGHASPVIDGLKILLGTIDDRPGMKGWTIPSGTRRFSPVSGGLFGLEGFSNPAASEAPQDRSAGTIGMGQNLDFGGISTSVPILGYHDVLIKWAPVPATLWDPTATPSDSNYSRAYRYLLAAAAPAAQPSFAPWIKNATAGFAYQDYNYGMPFSAWDMSTTPPMRLALGHLENNAVNGLVDGRYFPGLTNVDNGFPDGPREFAFVFATPYTTTPDPQYTIDLQNSRTPLMWVLTCNRRNDPPYSSADQFKIIAYHMPSSDDLWTFNPSILTTVGQGSVPSSFALLQNYPNPFNPTTTIRYELAVAGNITLEIYNVLGQEVRTLVNEVQNAGSHVMIWDSRNDAGNAVASGVYFYRLQAGGFVRTQKALLTR